MIEVSLPLGQSHPFSYDFDSSILLMDWYHKSASELAALITSTSHTMEDPQVSTRAVYQAGRVKNFNGIRLMCPTCLMIFHEFLNEMDLW